MLSMCIAKPKCTGKKWQRGYHVIPGRIHTQSFFLREAIAVAKLRLPAIDPLIPTLYAEWGDMLKNSTTEEEFAALW